MPIFVHNGDYYYSSLSVYEDGLVDCWGSVDLAIFRRKLNQRWVVTAVPAGARLSFHDLGWARTSNCEWQYTAADLLKRVEAAIDSLNPGRIGVIDMRGEETETRGNVRWAKFGLADGKPFRSDGQGNEIVGQSLPLFACTGGTIHLTSWFVFADGSSRVGLAGTPSPLDEVAKRVDGKDLSTSVSEGTRVHIDGLGWFESQNCEWFVKPEERVREPFDLLTVLQGGMGSIQECMVRFREYQANPCNENRERLRQSYTDVPEHLRRYCGDMDTKDWAIRKALRRRGWHLIHLRAPDQIW